MTNDVYDDLPDDPESAFVLLEQYYRSQMDEDVHGSEESSHIAYCRRKYMSAVVAAAKSLNIPGIEGYVVPYEESEIWAAFDVFETDVMNLSIQIKINRSRSRKKFSVSFDPSAKQKIRHYIDQIKSEVDKTDLSKEKKDSIFKRLNQLVLEIDRDRTRFEIVADGLLGVAKLSGDIEREGFEPWWKWVKLILGEVEGAKSAEVQSALPSPENRKRLQAPRKQLAPPPKKNSTLDDDIPF